MGRKLRSPQLLEYLREQGVLDGSDEAIAQAKRQYRRTYQRNWARQRPKISELRPAFSLKEMEAISRAAKARGLTKTALVKRATLEEAGISPLIPKRDSLLTILQKIAMAGILVGNKRAYLVYGNELEEADSLLQESEALLMHYLGYDP